MTTVHDVRLDFPACLKAVAERFPKRQRSLATGIFNTGTIFDAMEWSSLTLKEDGEEPPSHGSRRL